MKKEWDYRTDCRLYRGDKPCRAGGNCLACGEYAPVTQRILIIKLGARGDTLRTTPVLTGLRRRWPSARIVWLTHPDSVPLLEGNGQLDAVYALDTAGVAALRPQSFDLLLSLDKDPAALGLAREIAAAEKRGFALSATGTLAVFDDASRYALRLGLDDDLKFRGNTRSYQEITFAMCGLEYTGEEYILALTPSEQAAARRHIREMFGRDNEVRPIGLNTGCGTVFPTKSWTETGFRELAEQLRAAGEEVLLLGGRDEDERNCRLAAALQGRVRYAGPDNQLRHFAALIDQCAMLVTGDTLALHIALARRIPVVTLMGPTSAAEIDLYGRGEKIVAQKECAPCYRSTCQLPETCMQGITAAAVAEAVLRVKSQACPQN